MKEKVLKNNLVTLSLLIKARKLQYQEYLSQGGNYAKIGDSYIWFLNSAGQALVLHTTSDFL